MLFLSIFLLELVFLYFLSNLLQKSLSRVIFKITKKKEVTVNILLILFLPGVIVHELSHFLIASLFFVRTGEIRFLPQITEDGARLGSVEIEKTDPMRRAIIGFAPIFVGIAILLTLSYYFTLGKISGIVLTVVLFYLLFAIASTMFSSKKDLEGTIELLVTVLVIFAAAYITGVKAPFVWFLDILYKSKETFAEINILLLLPMGLNFILYFFTRLFY